MKRILIIAGALVGLVLITALMGGTRGKAQSSDSDSRIQQGFDNAPVTLFRRWKPSAKRPLRFKRDRFLTSYLQGNNPLFDWNLMNCLSFRMVPAC
jgi:hypothetical protein